MQSIGTQQLQNKASRSTVSKFSQMLRKPISSTDPLGPQEPSGDPSGQPIPSRPTTPAESTMEHSPISRRKSTDSMLIDDESSLRDNSDDYFSSLTPRKDLVPLSKEPQLVEEDDRHYLTTTEFKYTMNLVDNKIGSIYKLCRFIGDQQKENSRLLTKLVALDELSDAFWTRAYKEVAKKLLPNILFPSAQEYRVALEEYLSEHAEHFIEQIGRNSWISLFEEKLLAGVKQKGRSKRNDIAANIRSALFSTFGEERLERVDNNTPPSKLTEWKSSEKTKRAYDDLFDKPDMLSKIGYSVFKSLKEKELPTMHCAYILSICDIMLNPKSSGIKCNDRSVVRRVNAFLRAFENKDPVSQQIMDDIAEAEIREAEETRKKRRESGGSQMTEALDDDDYDDFVTTLDSQFNTGEN